MFSMKAKEKKNFMMSRYMIMMISYSFRLMMIYSHFSISSQLIVLYFFTLHLTLSSHTHTHTQLDVKGCSDIYESLRKYTGKEMLDGDNQYDAGPEFGKQDAEKGVIFTKFPPVLTVHLKRFDFDLQRMV